jgi:uncharacterized membrane protein YGL010W
MSSTVHQPRWIRRIWRNWRERHRQPINFILHLIGIPMTVAALPCLVLAWWTGWAIWLALALLVGGYVLQFIGHALEGNDPGEVILVKRWLGLPYTAIAPSQRSGSASPQQ